MVYFNEPITLTGISEYSGDLEDAIDRFNFTWEKIGKDSVSVSFCLYDKNPYPYLLLASQRTDGKLTEGFNFIWSVTSYLSDMNAQIKEKFELKTGINLIKTPPEYHNFMDNIGKLFLPKFEESEEGALRLLKGGIYAIPMIIIKKDF
jgi:hypothetical protein